MYRFLKRLRIKPPYDPEIPLLGIYLKNMETLIQKDICTSIVTATLFVVAKIWKQPKCPSIDEWIKKWHLYPMVCYSPIKDNDTLPLGTTWVDLECIMLSDIS